MRLEKCSKKLFIFALLLVFLLISLLYYSHLMDSVYSVEINFSRSHVVLDESRSVSFDDRYSLRTAGCSIERLDPWDQSLKDFFYKLPPFKCPQEAKDTLVQQMGDGSLVVDYDVLSKLLGNSVLENVTVDFVCYKRKVFRLKVEKNDQSSYRLSKNVTTFTNWVPMNEEYVQVKCSVNETEVYHNYFFHIQRKPKVERACRQNYEQFLTTHPLCAGQRQLSVLILGIDSVSKSNLLRQMPKTHDYVLSALEAIDMAGYNKVGLNTFPCLMPYLTGNSTDEIVSGCWGNNTGNSFDNCTFLWDLFASAGYRTAFVENMDFAGLLIFNRGGCRRQIAHYYGHTLYIPMQKYALRKGCWRGQSDDGQLLNWAYEYQKLFANQSHFGHFWLSGFSHDYVNDVQHLDNLFLETLQKMKNEGFLNDTLVVFMSDHGVRYGSFRENEIGRREENLPFMYLAFPPWFLRDFPEAVAKVKRNQNRLITTFDLHEFFKSIIDCKYVIHNNLTKEKEIAKQTRDVTFFSPISGNRTCEDAGIPLIYCACAESLTELDKKSKAARFFAKLVVDKLNEMTESAKGKCAIFDLEEVLSFKQFAKFPDDPDKLPRTIYNTHLISVVVRPGAAKFEATIQFNKTGPAHLVNREVRRINQYGNSSKCVNNDAFLKTICFCVNQAENKTQ